MRRFRPARASSTSATRRCIAGFIDSHTHLTDEFNPNYYRGVYDKLMRFPPEKALYAQRYARRTLEAGFTTVRNVGAQDHVDVGLRNAINAGVIEGPRILTAVYSLGSTGGHCDSTPWPPEHVPAARRRSKACATGRSSAAKRCAQQMKYGADVIKICASGGVLSEADPVDVPQLTPAELRAIMTRSAHVEAQGGRACARRLAARLAIEAGVDSIEHGSFLTEATLKLMKQKGVYLVPTRTAVYWVDKSGGHLSAEDRRQGARRVRRARHDVQERDAARRADRVRHRRGGVPAWHECAWSSG